MLLRASAFVSDFGLRISGLGRSDALLATALLLALPLLACAQNQIPAAINYQGRLTDVLGNPVGSGYYEVEFRIWDDAVQNGAGNLVWGRSFPLHVVTNGLFNILLTDDGGQITDPTTPTNTLLSAFGGPDRYLGLTITTSNGVALTESEISPRQQLASAPYAIQAQTANTVGPLGVTSTALASGAVVQGKIAANAVIAGTIADSAVTTAKLADSAVTADKLASGAVIEGKIHAGAVTTGAITNSAVTASKLNIDGDIHLNSHILFLNPGVSHGLAYFGGSTTYWDGINVNGPVLWGSAGGALGTTNSSAGGEATALRWQSDKSVTLYGDLDMPNSNVHIKGSRVGIGTSDPPTTFYVSGGGIGVTNAPNDNGRKMIHGDSGVSSSSDRQDVVAFFAGDIIAQQAVASVQQPHLLR